MVCQHMAAEYLEIQREVKCLDGTKTQIRASIDELVEHREKALAGSPNQKWNRPPVIAVETKTRNIGKRRNQHCAQEKKAVRDAGANGCAIHSLDHE